jgi:NAD(P)-dependent dehydrogenase (short-subunit alcohol dehydrogenase family)
MDVAGRTALVTGGAKRLGSHIVAALAQSGANVAVHYNTSAHEAEDVVASVEAAGRRSMAVQADIADPDAIGVMVSAVEQEFGSVDVLVNSASSFAPDPFPTKDHSIWLRTFDVLVHGPYYLANAVAPGMLTRGEGVIINIVDLSAWHPWPDRGAHSVAKAALLALTRQLAVELAPSARANAIAPGPTIPAESFDDAQIDRLAKRNLLGRWGGPDGVVNAVRYLVESDFVTGDCLTVDGGERWGHVRQRFAD